MNLHVIEPRPTPPPSPEPEIEVRVDAKREVAADVVTLTLRAADGAPLPEWSPGAHIDLLLDDAEGPVRQYSLCGDPADRTAWRIGVLREPEGAGTSRHVHDTLAVGDRLRVRGPRNNFGLQPSAAYLFIAGGIGITPLLSMIASADAAGAEWRLVYGGRRRASMAFLDELAVHGDRVAIHPQDEVGLLDLAALLDVPLEETRVYCCGPEPLLAAVEARCASWPEPALHVERFAPRAAAEPVLAGSFEVELARSGVTLTVPPDRSILEVISAAGIPVLSSCEEGTCGTCETRVLEGTPDHRDSVLDESEQAANDVMMICVSRSATPRLVLDL